MIETLEPGVEFHWLGDEGGDTLPVCHGRSVLSPTPRLLYSLFDGTFDISWESTDDAPLGLVSSSQGRLESREQRRGRRPTCDPCLRTGPVAPTVAPVLSRDFTVSVRFVRPPPPPPVLSGPPHTPYPTLLLPDLWEGLSVDPTPTLGP